MLLARLAGSYWLALFCLVFAMGCTHTTPTIAHTHIGHTITAFDGTPGEIGLFVHAEEKAQEALDYANRSVEASASARDVQDSIGNVLRTTVSEDFSLREALVKSDSHLQFAANSEDASANVKQFSTQFGAGVEEVLDRSDLIALLSNDVLSSNEDEEIQLLVRRIQTLAHANVHGGASATGGAFVPGTKQLRELLDEMINGEEPPYVTVDRWYLFHLVRLPDCDNCWAWRKWANSSNRGY